MFNIGFSEMMIIAVIALIFIGPKQLPELARTLGRLIGEFRKATDELTGTFTGVRETAEKYVQEQTKSIQDAIQDNQSYQDLIKPEGASEPLPHAAESHPQNKSDSQAASGNDQLEFALSNEDVAGEGDAGVPESAPSFLKPGGKGQA